MVAKSCTSWSLLVTQFNTVKSQFIMGFFPSTNWWFRISHRPDSTHIFHIYPHLPLNIGAFLSIFLQTNDPGIPKASRLAARGRHGQGGRWCLPWEKFMDVSSAYAASNIHTAYIYIYTEYVKFANKLNT